MTIKQLGGIFGRNPTFEDVTIEGQLTFEGNLDINSDITWEDNKKALFGDDGDLQIYHDGLNSFISDQGTGNLKILATDLQVRNAGDSGTLLTAVDGGAVVLKFNSNTKLATTNTGVDVTGNIAVNSGNGIDFSATSGTGTSELLDDYEEGTWTSTVGGNATYGVNTARYTKIGRQVFASFDLNITTIGTGSTVEISGLPFTCGDDIAEGVSISFYYGLATNVVELNAYVFGTTIRFRSLASAGSGLTDLAVLGDGCRVTGTAIYTTDS